MNAKPVFCGKCGKRLSSIRHTRYDEQTGESVEYGEESLMCNRTSWWDSWPCFTQYFLRDGQWIMIPELPR